MKLSGVKHYNAHLLGWAEQVLQPTILPNKIGYTLYSRAISVLNAFAASCSNDYYLFARH